MSLLKTLWIMKHEGNNQGWHNTTSKDKRERIALRNARWRMLELLKTNMCWAPCLFWSMAWWILTPREILKNNWRMKRILDEVPCWSSMKNYDNKRMIKRKGKLKRTLGEALQWLDEALKWYNWSNLELQKEKMNNLEPRIWYHERTPEEGINHLDETRIRIALCLVFTNLDWWQATGLAYYLYL